MTTTITILLVDDDEAFGRALATQLARRGYDVSVAGSGAQAIDALASMSPDVVLLDLRLQDMSGLDVLAAIRDRQPATEVIMLTGHGTIDTAIEAIRAGAFDYVAKPCPLDELDVRIQRARERQTLRSRATLLERGLTPADPGQTFVGRSPAFAEVIGLIERVAPTDAAVLITGETGTGKEMAATLVHARSARADRPFVVVECAALQENLLQSELFGHEKGAFTGADRTKPGLFEVAHGGTIFLDEIGEISAATQVNLLRVLDSSTFRHVGATREVRVDVRVVAATNRDLAALVRQGLFREDLFYRLSTFSVVLPPLRDRPEDIPLLASHFVRLTSERTGVPRRLGEAAEQALARHDWPGNVRELRHAIEAAMIVCDGEEIHPEHLPAGVRGGATRPADDESSPSLPTLEAMERTHIERALRQANGHRGRAAGLLGISERNLYRKIREMEERQPGLTERQAPE